MDRISLLEESSPKIWDTYLENEPRKSRFSQKVSDGRAER